MRRIEAPPIVATLMLALVVACGTLLWAAAHWARHESALLLQARSRHGAQVARAAAAAEHSRRLHALRIRTEAWRQRGLIGAADRLRWVENLGNARLRAGVGTVEYELAPSMPVPMPAAASDRTASALRAHATPMKLRMTMTDEDALLAFFQDLQSRAPGLFRFDACELSRLGDASQGADRLEARCSLDWLNVHHEEGGG